jgi:predicted 3-demethylubiquinone-9 3-methyltransferase (glyoxalase superfamily)
VPALQQRISPFLWFDTQAEKAAKFYTTVFDNFRIKRISRYGKAGQEQHGKKPGSVMVVGSKSKGRHSSPLTAGRISNSPRRFHSR